MSSQIITRVTSDEGKILDLEKKYTDILFKFLNSDDFKLRLEDMFIELDSLRTKIVNLYGGISIINTPAERLVTYCIYKYFFEEQAKGTHEFKKVEFFSFPHCGDLAIEIEEVVLNIEVKTVCLTTNSSDLGYIQFRANQTSFTNTFEYNKTDDVAAIKPTFEVQAHLDHYINSKPILTYVVEIVYEFDKKNPVTSHCELYKKVRHDGISTINLFCIPNGKLSRLFNNDIFQNVKAYKYYEEKENQYYMPLEISSPTYLTISDCTTNVAGVYAYLRRTYSAKIDSNWEAINNTDYIALVDKNKKGTQNHEKDGMLWILTKENKKPLLKCVKKPDGCRINWRDNLIVRFDSHGIQWKGVRHITI